MAGDTGDNGLLFGREVIGERERKQPETAAEKGLQKVRWMQERDFEILLRKLERGTKPLTAAEAKRLDDYERKFAAQAGEDLPEHVVRRQRDVAAHFGVHRKTIQRWVRRGMPALPDGYDLEAVEQWAVDKGLIERKKKTKPGGNGDGAEGGDPGGDEKDRKHWETEIKRLQAEMKQIEFDTAQGKLIPAEEVERGRVARVTVVKRKLLAIPRALAPQVAGQEPREAEALLMDAVIEICNYFAQGKV